MQATRRRFSKVAMHATTVRIPKEYQEGLWELALRMGISRSELLRIAIDQLLKEKGGEAIDDNVPQKSPQGGPIS